jgi:hypothetical protein
MVVVVGGPGMVVEVVVGGLGMLVEVVVVGGLGMGGGGLGVVLGGLGVVLGGLGVVVVVVVVVIGGLGVVVVVVVVVIVVVVVVSVVVGGLGMVVVVVVVVIVVVAGKPESFPVPAKPACGLVPFRGDFPVVTRVRPVPVSAFPFGELLKRAPAPERCVPVATIAWLR